MAQAAVFGVPDSRWGEEIGAWIKLHEGQPPEIKELRDEISMHLQAATPEQPLIVFLDALDQLADADNGRLLTVRLLGQICDC